MVSIGIPPWIKEHPYATGGIALVTAIVAWYLFGASSSSSGTDVSTDTSATGVDPTTASEEATQLTLAQDQAAAQQGNTQAQLAAVQDQDSSQVQIANLSAQIAALQVSAQQSTDALNITTTGAVDQSQIAAGVTTGQQQVDAANDYYTSQVTEDQQNNIAQETDLSIVAQTQQDQINATTAQETALTAAQTSLANSEITAQQNASDGSAYITTLYQNLLGRAPDPTGLSYWESVYQTQGASAVTTGFDTGALINAARGLEPTANVAALQTATGITEAQALSEFNASTGSATPA